MRAFLVSQNWSDPPFNEDQMKAMDKAPLPTPEQYREWYARAKGGGLDNA